MLYSVGTTYSIKKEIAFTISLVFVTPTIQFSNQLWVAFKKLYELKADIPVQLLQPVRGELYRKYAV